VLPGGAWLTPVTCSPTPDRYGYGSAVVIVPEVVRNKAILAGADEWLRSLPQLIAAIERDWAISVGTSYADSTEALVAQAVLEDGTEVVLKLMVPRDNTAAIDEIAVLRAVQGIGCPLLLRADESRGALLLERLGPSLNELGLPLSERHEILCATVEKVWRRAPDLVLPTGREKGLWLTTFITQTWDEIDRPCSERAVEYAILCADRRIAAHDDERAVLVHGDVHEWNALQSGDGFKLVDPDGLLAEAEYDMGILMREDPVELTAGNPIDRAHALARRTNLDPVAIWEWGVVERVSTGLLATQIELQPVGREMLQAADAIAEKPENPS